MVEKLFKLSENGTTVKTEIIAGITTFMTMAYILAVNPNILGGFTDVNNRSMDAQAVLLATAFAAFIGTWCMAFFANYPFALAPGLGLNAYFAYTVCSNHSWQLALFAVFVEGIVFIVLSLTNIREAIFNAIPQTLKNGVSVGIGLFVAFIGLQNGNVVVGSSATTVAFVSFSQNFNTVGISALLCLIGVVIIAVLHVYNVKGSFLIGIFATWILGIICELTGLYQPGAVESIYAGAQPTNFYSVIPSQIISFDFSSLSETFGQAFNFKAMGEVRIFDFVVIVFAFLFVDVFDTMGTLIGVSTKANMLDEDGKLPKIKPALLADAIATTAGAILGTSTTTTYVESSAGVSEGGRTGLASIVTGLLFLVSVIFSPLFITIPSFATAPALIFVGFLMITPIVNIDFDNPTDAIPAYLTLLSMPLMYSISDGISVGIISYVLIKLFAKKAKEVHPLMYVLAVLFVLKYIFFRT